jgi:hypothetical protein
MNMNQHKGTLLLAGFVFRPQTVYFPGEGALNYAYSHVGQGSLFWLIPLLLLGSCTGYQYVASPPYVPQHQKRGEWKGNIYPSGIQAGYSATPHLLFFTTAHLRNWPGGRGNPRDRDNVSRYRESEWSQFMLGTGYFTRKNRLVYEILLGGGPGKFTYTNSRLKVYNYKFEMKANTQNFYIQPDVGFSIRDHFTFAFFAKLNFCRYSHISTTTTLGVYSEPEFSDQEFINKKKVDVFTLSPGASFQGGWKAMKFHVQVSPNIKLGRDEIRHQVLNANAGLSFSFDRPKYNKQN